MNQDVFGKRMQAGLGLLTGLFAATMLNACSPKLQDQAVGQIDSAQNNTADQAIVGGTLVPAGNSIIKSIVAVYDISQGALCTGSLLENNIVMTAAHCVNEANPAAMIIIFDTKLAATSEKRKADKATILSYWAAHRGNPKNEGDIALIHFVGAIPAGYEAATFLPDVQNLKKDVPVVLAGFGITDGKTGDGAGVLRVASVTIFDPAFSQTEVKLDQTQGQGACHGDSGGPAYLYANGTYYLWGVTSRGSDDPQNDCTRYSVYTNALSYKSWIASTSKKLAGSLVNPSLALAN